MRKARRCGTHYTTPDIETLAPAVLVHWQAVCRLEFAFGRLRYVFLASIPCH